jgi:hypothetical protein
MHDQADDPRFELDDDDAILFVRFEGLFSESLAQIDDRNDPAAKVDDAFDVVRRVRNRRDLGNADDFANDGNREPKRLPANAEADDLEFLVRCLSGRFQDRTSSA